MTEAFVRPFAFEEFWGRVGSEVVVTWRAGGAKEGDETEEVVGEMLSVLSFIAASELFDSCCMFVGVGSSEGGVSGDDLRLLGWVRSTAAQLERMRRTSFPIDAPIRLADFLSDVTVREWRVHAAVWRTGRKGVEGLEYRRAAA